MVIQLKEQAEMSGRKHTCVLPEGRKENQGQLSPLSIDNIQEKWLNFIFGEVSKDFHPNLVNVSLKTFDQLGAVVMSFLSLHHIFV